MNTAQLDWRLSRRVLSIGLAVTGGSLAAFQPNDDPRDQRPSAQPAPVDTVAVRAVIDSLRSSYEQAVASGNFDPMGAMLAEGAVMVPPGGRKVFREVASSNLPPQVPPAR